MSESRVGRVAAALAATVWVAWASPAQAQPKTGRVSFTTGVDISHAYFFRGIRQERRAFIAQPSARGAFDLFDATAGLTDVTLTIGQWNSLHSGPSGAGGAATNVQPWYRSDFFTGVTLGLDNWQAGLTYASFMSPNDSFPTIQELALSLRMDDSALLGAFALSPHAVLAIETDGQADLGAGEGVYLELGVEPGFAPRDTTVRLTFPVTLALSLSDYYQHRITGEDSAFGYFSAGAVAALPLGVPESFGSWELSGGIRLYALGDTLEIINEGDQFQAVASIGIRIGY